MQLALLATFTAFIWGTNFVAVRILVAEIPVFILTGMRFLLVWILLLPWIYKKTLISKHLIVFGTIMGVCHFAAFFYGMKFLGAGTTSIILNLEMPFALLFATIFLDESFSLRQWVGFFISIAGICLLLMDKEFTGNTTGIIFCLIGAIGWPTATVYSKKYLKDITPLEQLGGMSLLAGMSLTLLAFFFGQSPLIFSAITFKAMLAFIYTVIASTIVAYGIWLWLNQKYDVTKTTPYILLVPIFALIGGWLILGEQITFIKIIAAGITIVGVYICTTKATLCSNS